MEILVLGGTGAMGKFLVKNLAESGHDISVTTRSIFNRQTDRQTVTLKA